MKLKPYIEDDTPSSPVDEILNLTGLKKTSAKLELDDIRGIFNREGAGIEDVAKMTGSLIRAAEEETTKLRAGELALKVQGIFKEMDDKHMPSITINVEGNGNQTLIELVCPVG